MARIFLSSTFKDLEECRKKISILLRQMGHDDIAMEYFIAEDKKPVDKCLEDVASCDLYIGIFAWRYGSIPEGYQKSITELEYRKAVETGKECLIFLLDDSALWPPKFVDKGTAADKIAALRNELSNKCIFNYFKSADELSSLVAAALHRWEAQKISPILEKETVIELDLKQYREAVSKRDCNIDLDSLTPSKKENYIKIQLSSVFVEQNVRENSPPVELPKEMWKIVHEEWDPSRECLPKGLTFEDIKQAKESYYLKDPKPVLDVISEEQNRYIVILGDPGSGKSTLTKYITLSVLQVNGDKKISRLFNSYFPLRIELGEFAGLCAEKECETFLDYFEHVAKTEGYNLTKKDVDNYLKNNGKAIVIFDGLDEIFDQREWERINRMIVGFTLDYPKARIIVTSRIVGYKRKILDDAGFVQFTLQDFENEQIETFLEKWYSFVVDEKEIENRKSRIIKALNDSSSIRQLAGNPLLLTILAIIGKHQELPRERWKLYDHAISVLVENWEVNKHLKRSSVDMDFIGEDDKKELLMKIAFKMQSSPEGLAGNFIHRKALQQEIEIYIQNRYLKNPSDAKLIAQSIVDQLRKVNFILCLYGADFYGFVHRTFLEYFCALDIVQKFDNHEIDPKTLELDYFEKYWEDPTWHEVLSLICGKKERFAGELIECLMKVYDPQYFGNRPPLNISLAIKCFSELRNPNSIGKTAKKLLERILKLFEMVHWTQDINQFLAEEVVPTSRLAINKWFHQDVIINKFSRTQVYMQCYSFLTSPKIDLNLNNAWADFIVGVEYNSKMLYNEALRKVDDKGYSSLLGVLVLGKYGPKNKDLFYRFLDISTKSRFHFIRRVAIQALARGWHDDPETFIIIKQRVVNDDNYDVRSTAIQELARGWYDDYETLNIIKQRAINDEDNDVRRAAIKELSHGWSENPEIFEFVKQRATIDEDNYVRSTAIQELARGWYDDYETLNTIKQRAINDEDSYVRSAAVQELAHGWHDDPETLSVIKQRAVNDEDNDVKRSAVQALARGWHDDPETLEFIKQSAVNDENYFVRRTAIQELARGWHDDPEILSIIKQRAVDDDNYDVRSISIQELVCGWHDDLEIYTIIKQKAINDSNYYVKSTAIQGLARGWYQDPKTSKFIKEKATNDDNYFVRHTAVQELARGWHDDPETLSIIKQRTVNDENHFVRCTAIQELARGWHDDPETLSIIKRRVMSDNNYYVRSTAIQALACGWHDDPETLSIIKRRAMSDNNYYVRSISIQELARGWHDDPETLSIMKQRAVNDEDNYVRRTAVQELTCGWYNDPETLSIIKRRAIDDNNYYVRSTAIQALARGWHDDPETLSIMKQRAVNDENHFARCTAIQELARGWHNDPETLSIIKRRAINDNNYYVRNSATKELSSWEGEEVEEKN